MKLLSCFVLSLLFAVSGFPQEKVIEKAEFDSVVQVAADNLANFLRGKPHSMTVETEVKFSGKPGTFHRSKMFFEWSLSGSRSFQESTFGTKPTKTETVSIGGVTYRRSNDGQWTKASPPNPAPAAKPYEMPPAPTIFSTDTEYKYLGTVTFRGESVRNYLKIERETQVDNKTGQEVPKVAITRYWISPEGMVLRSEFLATTTRPDATITTRINFEYQIDPTITITAPVIAP